MHLIFDFDGTITQQDTIGELARSAIEIQKSIRGADLQNDWDRVVRSYVDDYQRYKDDHPSPEATRTCVKDEIRFLSGTKDVEEMSLRRVAETRIFQGLDDEVLSKAGRDAVSQGRVHIRDGFHDLLGLAEEKGWKVGVVSVNWSRAFIRGALSSHDIHVIANEPSSDGGIAGPTELPYGTMTNAREKHAAVEYLVGDKGGRTVYFGDSTTDMECLLDGGVVISDDGESTLLKTLTRIGVDVPHVKERVSKVMWAKDFREVMDSGVLNE